MFDIGIPPGNTDEPVEDLLGALLSGQARTLPPGYEKKSAAEMTFDPRLAYELALEMDKPLAVFERYGYDKDAAMEMIKQKPFISTVKQYKEEILEHGVTFRLKAKIQAEDLLTHSYALAVDPTTPPAVRADLIKWTAKVAGLEPTPSKADGAASGQPFELHITFAGAAPPVVSAQRVIEGDK